MFLRSRKGIFFFSRLSLIWNSSLWYWKHPYFSNRCVKSCHFVASGLFTWTSFIKCFKINYLFSVFSWTYLFFLARGIFPVSFVVLTYCSKLLKFVFIVELYFFCLKDRYNLITEKGEELTLQEWEFWNPKWSKRASRRESMHLPTPGFLPGL